MDDSALSTTDAELVRLASVDLNLLVPLLALLETRSVTDAATAVGLSQPALSHTLRRLRRLLGDELLVRQGGTMILTPRAEQLVEPVRRALQQSARALRPQPFDPATDARTITLAMTTSTAFVLAPLLMTVLAERAPHIVLRLNTATMRSPTVFTDDGVDVVLLSESFSAPHPRERLYDDRWVVLASPSIDPSLDALALLSTQPHITFSDWLNPRMQPYEVLDPRGIRTRFATPSPTISSFRICCRLLRVSACTASRGHRVPVARAAANRGVPLPGAAARHRHGLESVAVGRALPRMAARGASRRGGTAAARAGHAD